MKKSTLGLVFLFVVNLLFGQITIEDGQEISGTWTIGNSPYIIEGEAIIPENETLIIEAGVEIKLKTGTNFDYSDPNFNAGFLRINGQISAIGTETDSIIFTKNGAEGNWATIFFNETANTSSIVKYCKIEHGNEISNLIGTEGFWGAVSFYKSSANIENNTIKNNISNAIYCYDNSSPTIKNNTVSNNDYIAILSNLSYPVINQNLIKNNNYGIYSHNYSASNITNNIIENNTNDGIFCDNSNSEIINNIISDNSNGINCYESSPNIVNNIISNNMTDGIYCYSNSSPDIINNTISFNGAKGIFCYEICSPEITNTIFWGNYEANDLIINPYDENTSHPKISYSLFEILENELQPEIQVLSGNIFSENPIFTDEINRDYHVQKNSPAVNSGTPNVVGLNLPEFCLDGTLRILNDRVDIGAFETDTSSINLQNIITENFIISPNPTSGKINFKFSGNNICNIKIIDLTGKIIIEKSKIKQNEILDLSNLKNGIYIINIQTNEKILTRKIIKI